MTSSSLSSVMCAVVVCLLGGCAGTDSQLEADSPRLVTADNQAGIWVAGLKLYAKGKFLASADLFQLA